MSTPEIQARIERLNREHPPAKGMEWRAVKIGEAIKSDDMVLLGTGAFETFGTPTLGRVQSQGSFALPFGFYFRQVPAQAKEEDLPQIPEELYDGHAVFSAMDEKGKKRTGPENVSDVLDAAVRLIKQRIKEQPAPAPAPGLDYERLFDWIHTTYYAMQPNGDVFSWDLKPEIRNGRWEGGAVKYVPIRVRNLPADWTQSLRVREPKPEPDVEPDENTPRLTEVEFQRLAPGNEWERGHLLAGSRKGTRVGSLVLSNDNCVLSVARCRLRREGK